MHRKHHKMASLLAILTLFCSGLYGFALELAPCMQPGTNCCWCDCDADQDIDLKIQPVESCCIGTTPAIPSALPDTEFVRDAGTPNPAYLSREPIPSTRAVTGEVSYAHDQRDHNSVRTYLLVSSYLL